MTTTALILGAVRRRFLEEAKALSWLFLMVVVSGWVALGAKACSEFIPRPVPGVRGVYSGSDRSNGAVAGKVPGGINSLGAKGPKQLQRS